MEAAVENGPSAAERLLAQHTAAQAHQPTVEEVVDEEDVTHPFPSAETSTFVEPQAPTSTAQPMSEKAAGKQRAQEPPLNNAVNQKAFKQNATASLDTQSEEAFPSLGPPKSTASTASAAAWANKPTSVNKENTNGFPSSNTSSGSSTPVSKGFAPSSAKPQQAYSSRGGIQQMVLPGRHTEDMKLFSHQLKTKAQLKKPIPEVLREINKKSKAKIEMRSIGDAMIFHGQGPNNESVRRALRELAAEVGAKQSVKVSIPASVRPHIIGKGGSTIRNITEKTGARVQMQRVDNNSINLDDDDVSVEVELEGDPIAVGLARREIEGIVNQHTSTVNTRMRNVPAELYPFLAGAHNSRISGFEGGGDVHVKIPQYETWRSQPPPQVPLMNQRVDFQPQEGYHIQISGEREATKQTQTEIERQVQELRKILTLAQISIERERHQFVLGDHGCSLHDFLEETGCSIILPPPSQDTEIITIIGPPQQIQQAVSKVEDLASRMYMSSVDVARQHPNAPLGPQAHARDVARYFQERQALSHFEQRHNAHVVLPAAQENSSAWQIFSEDNKNTTRARSDFINLISGHPPGRFRHVDMHPFYQREITDQHAKLVRDRHGVHVVMPEEFENRPEVLLVFEGPTAADEYDFPRSQPSTAEVSNFERALLEAERYLLGLGGDPSDIVQRNVEAPSKYREKIQKHLSRESQHNNAEAHPVQLIGLQDNTASTRPTSNFPVQFRGPSGAVEQYEQDLLTFIDQQIREEAERDYTTSFDFNQKYANLLIGKKGENINKIRDEFDVDIKVEDGKVEVKGPKAKADAAKLHIMGLARKFEDETSHILQIEPQYHRLLVGAKGSQIHRLQDRYGVIIQFPRNAPSSTDDHSIVAARNDAGSAAKGRGLSLSANQVLVKGPKKGADEAKDELWSLYQYEKDTSHAATISVAQTQVPSLIGQGGRELEMIRVNTGARIDVPGRDAVDGSGRVDIKVKGTKTQVDHAKKLLEEKIKIYDSSVTRTLDVERRHHQALVGRGGDNIRRLVAEAGGVDARMVQIPRADSSESTIRIEGNESVVEKILASIQAFVDHRENQVTESIEIPSERHGALIGRGGETRKALESEFNITLAVPNTTTNGPARNLIKITGLPTDTEKAKDHIRSMMKGQEGETVHVPRHLHHAIADTNGNFFRNLSRDLRVTVDHAGQQRPTRPDAPAGRTNGAASSSLPLITDDATDPSSLDVETHHSWEIIGVIPTGDGQDADATIPWVLKGPDAANVAKAKKLVEAAIATAENSVTGLLILPDPKSYRFVIGAGGATVNNIRKQTGSKIDVPKAGGSSEAIEIRGSRDAVEQAKEMVIEAVKTGNAGRR